MTILSLGGVDFGVDDLPEEVTLGGSQLLVIRQFPGGGLDVQPLGAYDDPIQWEGTFMFDDALDRALAIDDMRVAGQAIPLIIGRRTISVVISKFTYRYQHDAQVPYSIELQPLTAYGADITVNGEPDTTLGTFTIQSVGSSTTDLSTSSVPTPAPSPQRTYTVVGGDCLWSIAAKPEFYNDGSQWPKIADANPQITNPAAINPGDVLVIP